MFQSICEAAILNNCPIQFILNMIEYSNCLIASTGMFIKHLTDLMTDKIESKSSDKPKINLFSARETNIAALLKAIGAFKPHVPSYSCAVMFELLSNETDNYVGVSSHIFYPTAIIDTDYFFLIFR